MSKLKGGKQAEQTTQMLSKLKPQQIEQFEQITELENAGKTKEALETSQKLKKEVGPQTFEELEKIRLEKQAERQARIQNLQQQRKTAEAQRKLKEGIKEAEAKGRLQELGRADREWLNADPSGRRKELAFDPDKKKFDVQEARAAVQAEKDGLPDSPIRRAIDEHGRSQGGDYIDAKGKYWDVKDASAGADKIAGTAAPKQGGHPGENVLVDCSKLTAEQQRALEAVVKSKLPNGAEEVRFVPARKP